ncbi:MAG: membrane or secreted protein [Bacteroidota bacterium]|nr:membrane or secreted protein [Bacteroidota bacterium]
MKASSIKYWGHIFLGISFLIMMNSISTFFPKENNHPSPSNQQTQKNNLKGAWKMVSSGTPDNAEMTVIKVVTDTYFTNASYDKSGKEFIGTSGGTYSLEGGNYSETLEYFTWDSTKVGTSNTFNFKISNDKLEFSGDRDGQPFKETWEKIDGFDKNATPLAGTWRIRQRQTEQGEMNTIEWGPRKTLKILSGKRFQWIAYNIETKEFFGTGGGTYTTKNGKYVETLEFFSRDPQRVGAQLTFDFEVKGNSWHHKGKSSAGQDIYEVWDRVDQLN